MYRVFGYDVAGSRCALCTNAIAATAAATAVLYNHFFQLRKSL